VVAYQQQLRIARAKEMLQREPSLAQEKLAQACGFASARDFRRVWQRYQKTDGLAR
jgi:transcriptional regulator GlxA family with amidase domain